MEKENSEYFEDDIFYIPNIILVGAGRTQTYQHECLKCKEHFFCMVRNCGPEELFCYDCNVDESLILEKNKSSSRYVGNIVGWKVIVEFEEKHRTRKNYKKVYERDEYTCQYCDYNLENSSDFRPLHIDHIKPFCAGGNNSMDNLCVACQKCNLYCSSK